MDVVVNQYLNYLPPYATTLQWLNSNYNLKLEPYESFEYYVEKIQTELDLQEVDENGEEVDNHENENIETEYNPEHTHDIWEESDEIDEKTLKEFTEKFVSLSQKGEIPNYLGGLISALKK